MISPNVTTSVRSLASPGCRATLASRHGTSEMGNYTEREDRQAVRTGDSSGVPERPAAPIHRCQSASGRGRARGKSQENQATVWRCGGACWRTSERRERGHLHLHQFTIAFEPVYICVYTSLHLYLQRFKYPFPPVSTCIYTSLQLNLHQFISAFTPVYTCICTSSHLDLHQVASAFTPVHICIYTSLFSAFRPVYICM